MTPSASIGAFIRGYEKCRLRAYMPTANDVPTIGWGSTGSDIHLGMVWTQQQADERFSRDLAAFGRGVAGLIGNALTTQGQYDSMVSLAYNIGIANFAKSSVLTNHKAGHYSTAALAFQLWNKQRDKTTGQLVVLGGLTKRRAVEAKIYGGTL